MLMKNIYINIYTLLNQHKLWKKYEFKKLIIKFLKKSKLVSLRHKMFIKLISWDTNKKFWIGRHTNVCKKSGKYKRTFNQIGLSRHMLRYHLNENQLIHLKKMSW